MPLGISDHSLVNLVQRAHYTDPGDVKIITTRSFKKFDNEEFLKDIEQRQWGAISLFSDPNGMWEFWKNQFLDFIDKHAPLKMKRVGNKKSPWITNELVRKMRKRDFLKKKAEQSKDQSYWAAFRAARNEVNNAIKYAKRKYFDDNLAANRNDPRKTWQLINELSLTNTKRKLLLISKSGKIKLALH